MLRLGLSAAAHAGTGLRSAAPAAAVLTRGYRPAFHIDNVNQALKDADYAVRGDIVQRADAIRKEIKRNPSAKPYSKVIEANIGNPQRLKQKPITFFRQVLALMDYTDLLKPENLDTTRQMFPQDAIDRAQGYLDEGVLTGAYSNSAGNEIFRKEVADFIAKRDNIKKVNPNKILLTSGASEGVSHVMSALISDKDVGIMIPIPQYPLYSATVALLNGTMVPYFLSEKDNWALTMDELESSREQYASKGTKVRALCVIHPGNPTGQCMDKEQIKDIIRFAHRHEMVLLADEVYQDNCYLSELPFHSFRKVLLEVPEAKDELELISFHSVSKGVIGECGRRGGYLELTNINQKATDELTKKASISLCSNIQGQAMVAMMCNPPQEGDESYPLYEKETSTIFESLKRRAHKLAAAFRELEGISCNDSMGSMYLFPTIHVPEKAMAKAAESNMQPDEFYCMELLEATGITVVPGTGFKQEANTWHFRTTFLPAEEDFDDFIRLFKDFHSTFMDEYRD